jgi:hypothetical protein
LTCAPLSDGFRLASDLLRPSSELVPMFRA